MASGSGGFEKVKRFMVRVAEVRGGGNDAGEGYPFEGPGGYLLAEVAEGHVEGKVLGSFEIWPLAFRA